MSLRISITFLLLMFCPPIAKSACLNWGRSLGNTYSRKIYVGELGGHPIRMMLHLDVTTGHFDGAYGYNNQPGMLILTGRMHTGGVKVDLKELNKQGLETGQFSLGFFESLPVGISRANYENHPADCDTLTGYWRPSSGKESQLVELYANGMVDPYDDQEREINEITAYKLRLAMLNKDKHAFASLLKYPFYTNGFSRFGGAVRLFNNTYSKPEEVIKNYDKIVLFSRKEISDAVPHVLDTYPEESDFMGQSILITDGKVTRMCAGACPIDP